jgi:oxygen-independent coproporphyrinogen-3 oxidase
MAETMWLGLRLTQEGIAPDTFRQRFGRDLESVYGQQIDSLIAVDLLEHAPDGRVRLTPRGRLLGNHVFEAFV